MPHEERQREARDRHRHGELRRFQPQRRAVSCRAIDGHQHQVGQQQDRAGQSDPGEGTAAASAARKAPARRRANPVRTTKYAPNPRGPSSKVASSRTDTSGGWQIALPGVQENPPAHEQVEGQEVRPGRRGAQRTPQQRGHARQLGPGDRREHHPQRGKYQRRIDGDQRQGDERRPHQAVRPARAWREIMLIQKGNTSGSRSKTGSPWPSSKYDDSVNIPVVGVNIFC